MAVVPAGGGVESEVLLVIAAVAATRWGTSETVISIVVVVLIAFSGFMALAETSLTRISRVKAQALIEQKRRGAKLLAKLIEHPSAFLNAILLSTLVSQLVAATLVGVIAERLFGALGVTVAIVFEVLVIFVAAEALPKNYAVSHPESAALFSAPLIQALVRFPLIRVASWFVGGITNLVLRGRPYATLSQVSEEELLAMADAAAEEEVIENEEREFIASVIEFGDTVAREIMVPRLDMVAAQHDLTVEQALELALNKGYSRLPVYRNSLDNVTGILHAKDLMRAYRSGLGSSMVTDIQRKAVFVPETKPTSILLREMQAGKYHIVIVVDEYGGTAGLVTMEDLIEELVGEITDEFDLYEAEVVEVEPGRWLIKATAAVDELNETLELELPTGDWDTVGGLFLQLLGHLPIEGETARTGAYQLVAEKMVANRIVSVRLERVEEEPLSIEEGG
ncbi:MAG: hemolysin family protein [Actinomycetota bacterium]|nr:hemolysin family protein [Actinomycetota bacterium]